MKEKLVCKVCGQVLENESPLEHIQKHDVLNYFDVYYEIAWDEKVG